jgi:hypothetical protein
MLDKPHRRTVLAAAATLAGAAASQGAIARPAGPRRSPLTLFDPEEPAARAFAASQGGRAFPIEGDRIRLARGLFAKDAPSRLTVIARHADQLILAEAAREAGYRSVALDPFPALDARGGVYIWTASRLT